MSSLDMSEAVRMLANEKNISVDTLLHVLVDALATAYKRRPGAAAEVVVEVNPDTLEFTFTAYDVDEDGLWINERDDTPKKEEMGRIAAQTFRQVMGQRIREAERDRKFEEYANREGDIVTGIIQQTDARYTLLDLGRVESLLPQAEQVPFERPEPGAASRRTSSRSVRPRRGRRSSSAAPTRVSSSGCSSSRCPRSPTASSRSGPAPVSQGTARRSPCGATTTTSTPSARASAPVAGASAWSSTSCAARRSTSSRSARTSPTSSRRRCRRRR
jgi:hypothetical protein